jgi:hypothetical protein
MYRCATITTAGSVARRAALWQSEDENGKNVADTVAARSEGATDENLKKSYIYCRSAPVSNVDYGQPKRRQP